MAPPSIRLVAEELEDCMGEYGSSIADSFVHNFPLVFNFSFRLLAIQSPNWISGLVNTHAKTRKTTKPAVTIFPVVWVAT